MTVIGFLQRSVKIEGVRYFWEEYLLYQPRVGFRWLVRSDDHWNYVRPLPPGQVQVHGKTAQFDGRDFKLFQRAPARVEVVLGEFYWKVHAEEAADTADYVRPPEMLSREKSGGEEGEGEGEINWSHGTYLPRAEVEQAFGLKKHLPVPTTVAPNQPFPYKRIYPVWGVMMAAALLLGVVVMSLARTHKAYEQSFTVQPTTNPEAAQEFFSESGVIELKAHQNVRVTARAHVDNSWVYLDGALVNEETGEVQTFAIPVEYYHGVEDGESWAEGSPEEATYLSSLPAGKYTLALEVSGEVKGPPLSLNVRVDQAVPRLLYWLLTLAALSALPLGVAVYHVIFESRRWQDSNCR
jgi:hypothetical protein